MSDAVVSSTMVADVLISVAYFAIPVEIWFFKRALAKPLPFTYILVFFQLFIFTCGLTHLVGIWAPWSRSSPVLLATKAVCAVISVTTAVLMVTVLPKVFSFPVRTALMEEELSLRICHEKSLQKANNQLIKFRRITGIIRHTLDVATICDSAVMEICQSLGFTGVALFLPMEDGKGYVCQAEFITSNKGYYQTHYWKTITLDSSSSVVRSICGVACVCYLSAVDLVVLANKQRGMLYRSGLAMSFQDTMPSRGFVLAFNEVETPNMSEDDVELFQDIVAQIDIALTQAQQIRNEHIHLSALKIQVQDNVNLDRERHSAETASRVKTHLLASMGQEMMAPVNDIRGLASFLLDTPLTSDQRNAIEMVLLRSKSLDIIKNDLNDFVKIDKNGLVLEHTSMHISSCLEEALAQVRDFSQSKAWILEQLIEDGVPRQVVGDPIRLQQIIANILSNILTVAPTPGTAKVTVSLSSSPPTDASFLSDPKCFKFTHHLNPISKEKLAKSTRIYFHIVGTDQPTIASPKPSLDWIKKTGISVLRPGLGLTVVAHLIQLFNGDLVMRSCAGHGIIYSFSICLPAL
ncbi:hypothetical protein DSO57_1020326 [Entomophthora muscae]|uniref:Uncharacterized protein n=1 Tax=Entomophthora muscae TaxID=34485 RepID=A0ACC2SGH2_9FUNG|nr:hypothetical protein DSO57_1020326 [Entomophthora muscae]